MEPEELYNAAARITLTVLTTLMNGKEVQGTGFFISHDLVVTNWHMIRNAFSVRIIDSSGNSFDAKVVSIDEPTDLAGLRTTANNKYAAYIVADSEWEKPGERIYVFGNPKGMEVSLTNGLLSARRINGALFQISAPINHGSSGSPVFNEYGLVIGMISRGLESQAEINFAISANVMWEALGMSNDEHPEGFKTGITAGLDIRSDEEKAEDKRLEADAVSALTLTEKIK